MLALSQDLSQNRPVEAREHSRRFHELFFTLSPDRAAIESNINRALFLVDKSAFEMCIRDRYFTYTEEHPISFNPFYTDGAPIMEA